MFGVRQLGNKSRLFICIENLFKNYHFPMRNAIRCPKEMRSDTENLDGSVVYN